MKKKNCKNKNQKTHYSGILVTMRHIRQAEMCSHGGRAFFDAHGLDWSDFLKNGVAVEIIEGLGDFMASQVAIYARKENLTLNDIKNNG